LRPTTRRQPGRRRRVLRPVGHRQDHAVGRPDRTLIGDDEHGWSDRGIFNFEGGCYAKTINLSPEAEPEIYATTHRFGPWWRTWSTTPKPGTGFRRPQPDRKHPLRLSAGGDISNASATGLGGHPKHVVMLTCDAFGVLPPIARLTPAQAMYHFLSGFTSKAAGTERGITEPTPTFSTCFGAPFMPRRPEVYGKLLQEKIAKTGATCWLVNTGWTGGAYGTGKRMPIKATRALLTAALDGSLAGRVPQGPELRLRSAGGGSQGVDAALLNPRETWADKAAYDAQARKLVEMFSKNFGQYVPFIDEDVKAAAIG
jgi:phosphoenolpyruvate carboxykinase (ATP)